MEDNYKKFIKHLRASNDAVFVIAKYLHERGYGVTINVNKETPSHAEWAKYTDDGDIIAHKNGVDSRVEVKHSGTMFTSAKDWPYRDKFMVCAKHSYDLADPKPVVYFILNKAMTHFAMVLASTKPHWTHEERKDSRYKDYSQQFYFCPTHLIKWVALRPL